MSCEYSNEDKGVMLASSRAKNSSRLIELINYAKNSGYKRLGVANCFSMQSYANKLVAILEENGFDVYSINCKDSGLRGEEFCEEMAGAICDPIAQANFLNDMETDLNISVGQCLGHGLLFQKYSKAEVTTFIVKDIAHNHNTIESLS